MYIYIERERETKTTKCCRYKRQRWDLNTGLFYIHSAIVSRLTHRRAVRIAKNSAPTRTIQIITVTKRTVFVPETDTVPELISRPGLSDKYCPLLG
jgi:hypothetical protein